VLEGTVAGFTIMTFAIAAPHYSGHELGGAYDAIFEP